MLILTTLARGGDRHGFEIAEGIERASAEVLHVEEGSLPPPGREPVQLAVAVERRVGEHYERWCDF